MNQEKQQEMMLMKNMQRSNIYHIKEKQWLCHK